MPEALPIQTPVLLPHMRLPFWITPHKVSIYKRKEVNDAGLMDSEGGSIVDTSKEGLGDLVEADVPCLVESAGASQGQQFGARGMTITHHVYIPVRSYDMSDDYMLHWTGTNKVLVIETVQNAANANVFWDCSCRERKTS